MCLFALAAEAFAGLVVTGSNGIAVTGADGIVYTGTSGLMAPASDGLLAFTPNGISAPWTSGIAVTGADAATYASPSGLTATGVDSTTIASADGFTATGPNGIAVTGADGTVYLADSVVVSRPTGIAVTGADGIAVTGADGIAVTGADSATVASADGVTGTNPAGIAVTGADGIAVTGADGQTFTIEPNGIAITGADGIAVTGADGIAITGADGIAVTGADGVPAVGSSGLQSLDPELAVALDAATDDSNVNAAIVYHGVPTSADLADLRALGVLGGTRYRAIPVILVTATKRQIVAVSHLPAVRAIYGVRTFQSTADVSRSEIGATRLAADADVAAANGGRALSGRGVTVAILDTGINGSHPDVAGRVAQNVRLADRPGAPTGFAYPVNVESVVDTDTVSGHGTFVAGIVGGSGAASAGRIQGVAPGASLVGLSAGALDLPHVLAGFDYLLDRGAALGVRVVNCSFSASTVFDVNDPVNVATKLLVERGVNVVFSAGNTGPGWNTLNPYAAAPWVVSVGATGQDGRPATYSSRGAFGSEAFRPTLVAPGTGVVSLRSSPATSVTGALGLESGADAANLTPGELPFYTTSSGTSFSAPMVAGTIALILEANPSLGPEAIKDLLQRSATPLPPYLAHEVGAGALNAHAAVLEAAFAERRMGAFRATLDRGQVTFVAEPARTFEGTASPTAGAVLDVAIPAGAIQASVQIAWGPLLSTNDLGLALEDAAGTERAVSNTLNLPGLTGRRERVVLDGPAAGTWRARVTNTLGVLGTAQAFSGAVDVARANVAPLADLESLSAAAREEILLCVRSFVMFPHATRFRPSWGVNRRELAETLVLGARVPQYLAGSPMHSDVRDSARIFVESVQASPRGPLFADAAPGGAFRPEATADRLTAAIALVRALGLGAEADRRAGESLSVSDSGTVAPAWRGYVAIALERGLLVADGGAFRPEAPLTRAALAHAMARVMAA